MNTVYQVKLTSTIKTVDGSSSVVYAVEESPVGMDSFLPVYHTDQFAKALDKYLDRTLRYCLN